MVDRLMMRYFYDFEFLEDGHTIEPISIGIRAEDGREYYAVFEDAPWLRILEHEWLMANVVPSLPLLPPDQWFKNRAYADILDGSNPAVKVKMQVAREVREFFLADGLGDTRRVRELWAWYSAHDHVALCQLWGRMVGDVPDCVPHFTRDIKSEAVRLGVSKLPAQPEGAHNALADARYNFVRWEYLRELEALRISEASGRVACCPMDLDTAAELLDVLQSGR